MSAPQKKITFTPPTTIFGGPTHSDLNLEAHTTSSVGGRPSPSRQFSFETDYTPFPSTLSALDLDFVDTIRRSTFSEVVRVRRRDTGQIVVVKAFSRSSWRSEYLCSAELRVLQNAQSPWFVHFFGHLQDIEEDFLLYEYLHHGNFLQLVSRHSLSEQMVTFFAAEMFLAVDSLHNQGIMHRNIQLSNFLIHHSGHLRLSGFGLSYQYETDEEIMTEEGGNDQSKKAKAKRKGKQKLPKITNPVFASAELSVPAEQTEDENSANVTIEYSTSYMAPEVVSLVMPKPYFGLLKHHKAGYSFLCDYWSLGVAIYRMSYGRFPFVSDSKGCLLDKIMDYRKQLTFPLDSGTKMTELLLKALLKKESSRLGSERGFEDVQEHPFFSSIQWTRLGHGRIGVPPTTADLLTYVDAETTSTTHFEELDLETISESNLIESKHSASSNEDPMEANQGFRESLSLQQADFQMPLCTDPSIIEPTRSAEFRTNDQAKTDADQRATTTSSADRSDKGRQSLSSVRRSFPRQSVIADLTYMEKLMRWFHGTTTEPVSSDASPDSKNSASPSHS